MYVRHAAILEKAARDGRETSHKVSLLHAGASEVVNTVQLAYLAQRSDAFLTTLSTTFAYLRMLPQEWFS